MPWDSRGGLTAGVVSFTLAVTLILSAPLALPGCKGCVSVDTSGCVGQIGNPHPDPYDDALPGSDYWMRLDLGLTARPEVALLGEAVLFEWEAKLVPTSTTSSGRSPSADSDTRSSSPASGECSLDTGDGTELDVPCTGSMTHTYDRTGTYEAWLTHHKLRDTSACQVYRGGPCAVPEKTSSASVRVHRAPLIYHLAVTPEPPVADAEAVLWWRVRDPDGSRVTCTVDLDGDGAPDMRVRGCEAEPGAHVVFATTGRRQVELTASDGHADTSRSLGVVVMRAEQAGVADAASKIGALAWSPAPESLAVATSSGQVLRLDPASAATLWDTGPRASRLQALAWTPSAEVLVAGGDDGSLLRISAADGAVVGEIGLGAPVSALATFAGGTLSCAAGTKLLLWR